MFNRIKEHVAMFTFKSKKTVLCCYDINVQIQKYARKLTEKYLKNLSQFTMHDFNSSWNLRDFLNFVLNCSPTVEQMVKNLVDITACHWVYLLRSTYSFTRSKWSWPPIDRTRLTQRCWGQGDWIERYVSIFPTNRCVTIRSFTCGFIRCFMFRLVV